MIVVEIYMAQATPTLWAWQAEVFESVVVGAGGELNCWSGPPVSYTNVWPPPPGFNPPSVVYAAATWRSYRPFVEEPDITNVKRETEKEVP